MRSLHEEYRDFLMFGIVKMSDAIDLMKQGGAHIDNFKNAIITVNCGPSLLKPFFIDPFKSFFLKIELHFPFLLRISLLLLFFL